MVSSRNANDYLCTNWRSNVGGDVALYGVRVVENLWPLLFRFFRVETSLMAEQLNNSASLYMKMRLSHRCAPCIDGLRRFKKSIHSYLIQLCIAWTKILIV